MPAHTITPPPPWTTRPQHWHQQTAHPHDAIHAVCHLPCTVKTRIHPWREHLSKVPDAIECEHLPTQVSYDDQLQSGQDPDEDDEHADELPWDCFWQFVQKFFGYANRLLQQLSGWLVSDDLGGEDAGCGGPGLMWLHMVCGCEAGWMYLPKSLTRLWRRLMVDKWTFNSRATALVDIPAVSMPTARSLKTCDICGIVLCDKTAHFRVAFYCGQPEAHLCYNHAV